MPRQPECNSDCLYRIVSLVADLDFTSPTALRRLLLAVKVSCIFLLTAVLYTSVLRDLAKDWWTEPNLSYGILIPPLALYIAWAGQLDTFAIPVQPDNRGLLLIAGANAIYLIGELGSEFFLPRISFVVLVAGIIWTFWGIRRAGKLTFPLLLLGTMVPLPVIVYNLVAAPLQLLASNAATAIAQLAGTSAYQDGNIITLANMSLGVEEACSGLNSLSSLVIASIVLSFTQFQNGLARIGLILLSIPLAIFVNILRVAGTAILADHDEKFARGFYHSFSGWLIFVVGLGALYGTSMALKKLAAYYKRL